MKRAQSMGDQALQYRLVSAIDRLAAEMCANSDEAVSLSLANGLAGRALFLAFAAQATGESKYREFTRSTLEQIVQRVARERVAPGFYQGLQGIVWAVNLAATVVEDQGPEDTCAPALDSTTIHLARNWPLTGPFDVVSGIVGLGIYGLGRVEHGNGQEIVGEVVRKLAAMVEQFPEGTSWRTRPEYLLEATRQLHPGGMFDLGVAHGAPGVVAFLSAASMLNIERPTCDSLLASTFRWLEAQLAPATSESVFAYFAGDTRPARPAWCYGDPGILAVLVGVENLIRRFTHSDLVALLKLRILGRAQLLKTLTDINVCHGCAGLAHMFARVAAESAHRSLMPLAISMYERTLELIEHGVLREVTSWDAAVLSDADCRHGFIMGTAGVGLCLTSAVLGNGPQWDRILLLSPPTIA